MKLSPHNIDAKLHEAADMVDHITGQPSSMDEESQDASEPAAQEGSESSAGGQDLSPVVAMIQKISVFKDVPEEVIVKAIQAIPAFKGKTGEDIVKILAAQSGLKSMLMSKVGELADAATESENQGGM